MRLFAWCGNDLLVIAIGLVDREVNSHVVFRIVIFKHSFTMGI